MIMYLDNMIMYLINIATFLFKVFSSSQRLNICIAYNLHRILITPELVDRGVWCVGGGIPLDICFSRSPNECSQTQNINSLNI